MSMDNTTFFIKYLKNQPVKVESHFVGEAERKRPLRDVADIIQGTYVCM
jgi:hypothetical protein